MNEHPGSGHAKVIPFPLLPFTSSSGSIHTTSPAQKRLHNTSSRCGQIRENCFAHLARVGNCHRRDVQLQSMRATQPEGHALHAPLLLCAFQKYRCISRRSSHSCTVPPSLGKAIDRSSTPKFLVSLFSLITSPNGEPVYDRVLHTHHCEG